MHARSFSSGKVDLRVFPTVVPKTVRLLLVHNGRESERRGGRRFEESEAEVCQMGGRGRKGEMDCGG